MHPSISEEERKYIEDAIGESAKLMNPVTVRAQAWGVGARWGEESYQGRGDGRKRGFESALRVDLGRST